MMGMFKMNRRENPSVQKAMEEKNEKEKMASIAKINAISYQNIILRAQEILNDEDNQKLDEMVGNKNFDKEMLSFLQEKIPNFSEIIKEEVMKTQNNLENEMQELEKVETESILKIGGMALEGTINNILGILEGEEKESFKKMLDKGDEKEVYNYIEENFPNMLNNKIEDTKNDFNFLDDEIEKNLAKLEAEEKAKKQVE